MLSHSDVIASERFTVYFAQSQRDASKIASWVDRQKMLALDTESTGINPYVPGWKLRTFQCGSATQSFVIPAKYSATIERIVLSGVRWLGHNGPHDIRSIDQHLGYETGTVCRGETYLPGHHRDPRNRKEGGTDHGLKEQCEAFIDSNAGKWERALKSRFKEFTIPIPGEFYKSGPRKGLPKSRKAKLSEGWGIVATDDPAYWIYAGTDPILTFRLWRYYKSTVRQFIDQYHFDHRIQLACDRLNRRGIKLDVPYTRRLQAAYGSKAAKESAAARRIAGEGPSFTVYSGARVAEALLRMGCRLTELTPTGAPKTDVAVMQGLLDAPSTPDKAKRFIKHVLTAKRCDKRREAYALAMLSTMDADGRIHPSINSLAARTSRMSVSSPALQQLPTADNEEHAEIEELVNG